MTSHQTDTARRRDDAEGGTYAAEHWLAWALAGLSLILGWAGLLRGFGLLGNDGDQVPAVGGPTTQAAGFGSLWDCAIWFLPAISLALVSYALHRSGHHRSHARVRDDNDADESLRSVEHGLAWLMALLTLGSAALGLVVGFDLLGRGNDQPDALPWLFAALHYGVLTMTLHAVGHHEAVTDEDHVARMVERHMAAPRTAGAPATSRYSAEPRR